MKWLSSRFTYPLIIVSLIVCIILQIAWLQQLFIAQKLQLKELIEQNVGEAAKVTIYNSLAEKKIGNTNVKKFFLSPQWLQMRQAFDDLKMNGIHSVFDYGITDDSAFVEIKFSFLNKPVENKKKVNAPVSKDTSRKELKRDTSVVDSSSLLLMNKEIKARLKNIGITGPTYYAIYKYGNEELDSLNMPQKYLHRLEFTSKIYSYNLKHIHKYQLLIPFLNGAVFYRMRYYMISSLLMIILTGASFYFIIQLLKKQKLYSDAKISFTNNMTHEFKTPVSTVAVALESITKYNLINDPEKLTRYLDISRTELKRLDAMIEKVLNLNQNNEVPTHLNLELYDVQAGLEQVVESMKIPLESNQFSLTFNKSGIPCFVYGDPIHLSNVFYNLIDNSIKYAGSGSNLEITSSCNEEAVIIKIKDNGVGIDGQYLSKVFDRFFRIPSGDTHDVKGSGLGLHYVRQIIEDHKGHISLKSEVRHGCTFIIKLPKA